MYIFIHTVLRAQYLCTSKHFVSWVNGKFFSSFQYVIVFYLFLVTVWLRSGEDNIQCCDSLTINVPLFKKLRDIIFFCGTITLWAISRDILRGPRLFWPLKLSRAQHWREVLRRIHYVPVLGRNVHIRSFRTFKKSRALYKVHNMGLRYIKVLMVCINFHSFSHCFKGKCPIEQLLQTLQRVGGGEVMMDVVHGRRNFKDPNP